MVLQKKLLFTCSMLILILTACNLPVKKMPTPSPEPESTRLLKTANAVLTASAPIPSATNALVATQLSTNIVALTQPPTSPPPPLIPCDQAGFGGDVTLPDDTVISPGQNFIKTWQLINLGSCTWTTAYKVVYDGGSAMNAPASFQLPGTVYPGQVINISVSLTAPSTPGVYTANFKLRNPSGATFGVGVSGASQPFYVRIQVLTPVSSATPTVTPTITPTVTPTVTSTPSLEIYNFASHYCDILWTSGAGILACPGTTNDSAGFVVQLSNPIMETGLAAGKASIETHPQWVNDGYIEGRFPAIAILPGYRFKSTLGCLNGGTACDVTFQLNYISDGGPVTTWGTWGQTYDGSLSVLDLDLAPLAGHSIQFILRVHAHGAAAQDWAVWIDPRVTR